MLRIGKICFDGFEQKLDWVKTLEHKLLNQDKEQENGEARGWMMAFLGRGWKTKKAAPGGEPP